MKKFIIINKKLESFSKKNIKVSGDKSLSIRFVILSSLAHGVSNAQNILKSEDVISAIRCIRKLGIKINVGNNSCKVFGKGLNGFKYKKNLTLDAGNSGTTARLLTGALVDSNFKIKMTGDASLKKRDMNRIINPLEKMGLKFNHKNGKLPFELINYEKPKNIFYQENLGSAQCKSAVMIAGLKTKGKMSLKCAKSRNHTELMFKNVLKIPMNHKEIKNKYDLINFYGQKKIKSFNYKIPGDISSASFFIVLTLLSKKSNIEIKRVNINKSRLGIINILNKMNAKIKIVNRSFYKGEEIGDILVQSNSNLKSVNLNSKYNSSAIDEFLLIFLCAAKSKGVSKFYNLGELNKKESKRFDWGIKILKLIGIKVKKNKNYGLEIHGNPKLNVNKDIIINNFLKDHRIFMVTTIAALTLGGNWKIFDPDSIKTSFPTFLKIIKNLGAKIN